MGYENEGTTFTANPSDSLDRTVQGVKFSWDSSDPTTLQIDEAGRARFLQPGLVRVTCRLGAATASAPVLIRANHRRRQTDAEWHLDQASSGRYRNHSGPIEWIAGHRLDAGFSGR